MGTIKLCRFNGAEVETYKAHADWRDTWHHAVYLPMTGGNGPHLFLYDRMRGEAKVLAVSNDGSFTTLKNYDSLLSSMNPFFGSSWDIVVSGQFCTGSTSDLFLYDRQRGVAAFASVAADGTIDIVRKHNGWRKSWDIAVAGNWSGSGWHDILLYDRLNGEAKLLVTDGNGGLTTKWHFTGWSRNWDLIVPGNYATGLGHYNLLFYRRVTGDAVFSQLTEDGQWNELARHVWDPDWDVIVKGRFGADKTRLFLYSRRNPRAALVEVTGKAQVEKIADLGKWRPTWWSVVPGGWQSNGANDELFLYDNRIELEIRAIRVADDDGSRQCSVTRDEVERWVDYANKVYASAGVQFTFTFEDMNDTTINKVAKDGSGEEQKDARKAAVDFAAQVEGSIVVFFTYGPFTTPHKAGFSGYDGVFVSMPYFYQSLMYYRDGTRKSVDNLSLLAHELGHYLGIPHPFAELNYNNASSPEQVAIDALKANGSTSFTTFDNDANFGSVFDTPPDIGPGYYLAKGLNPADPGAHVVLSSPEDDIELRFSPDRHNVMSYFNCDEFSKITPDQARRVREHLHSDGRKHLLR